LLFKNKAATSALNLLIYILIISFSFEAEVRGASSELYSSERITAQLITAENGVNSKTRTISAALFVSLNDGWKTYWRSPGEVGYPPTIDCQIQKTYQTLNFTGQLQKDLAHLG